VEREKAKQREEKLKKEGPVTHTRRWNHAESSQYTEQAQTLAEMGFDYNKALQALCANSGDMMEAMDHLSNMPASYSSPEKNVPKREACRNCGAMNPKGQRFCGSCGASLQAPPSTINPPPRRSSPEVSSAPSAPAMTEDADENADEKTDDEELLAKALAESMKEEENRKKEQACEDEDLEAVLALSLKEALELSQRQEEERQRMERREEEELERALRESSRIYEEFHKAGNEGFEEEMRLIMEQSLEQAATGEEDYEQLQKAIQQSYNETYSDFEEEVMFWEPAIASHSSSPSQGPAAEPAHLNMPQMSSSSSSSAAAPLVIQVGPRLPLLPAAAAWVEANSLAESAAHRKMTPSEWMKNLSLSKRMRRVHLPLEAGEDGLESRRSQPRLKQMPRPKQMAPVRSQALQRPSRTRTSLKTYQIMGGKRLQNKKAILWLRVPMRRPPFWQAFLPQTKKSSTQSSWIVLLLARHACSRKRPAALNPVRSVCKTGRSCGWKSSASPTTRRSCGVSSMNSQTMT